MRSTADKRLVAGCLAVGYGLGGIYQIMGPCGTSLRIIASNLEAPDAAVADGWEHVSVSCERRAPNWQEMCFVKSLFWDPEDTVIQLHPPESTWISNHPNCLHLWRDTKRGHNLPPPILVGIKELGDLTGRGK